MISILIPCFNYNAYPLVSAIEKQALMLNINFEIICIDDGSFSTKNEENQKINLLTNSKFIESKKNLGRIKNRILLAEKSQYDWLLFLDVDILPFKESFLKKYISFINGKSIIFGGCIYEEQKNFNSSLRYEYGKKREEKKSEIRNKNPYKYISSLNFLCKKNIIINILSKIEKPSYGNDYIFGSILKDNYVPVLHIDNEVIIKNIDGNDIFINKTKQALKNLLFNYKNSKIKKHSITILNVYVFLERLGIKEIFLKVTDLIKTIIENNLKQKHPSMFLFDLFRLRYLCRINNF